MNDARERLEQWCDAAEELGDQMAGLQFADLRTVLDALSGEVTDAMIEAGIAAWPDEDDTLFDTEEEHEREVVRRILRAALLERGRSK